MLTGAMKWRTHLIAAGWQRLEERRTAAQSISNQPQTLDDFEQLIYDDRRFMQKQVDRYLLNRARRSKTVLKETRQNRVC